MRLEFFKNLVEKYGGTETIGLVEYSGTLYTGVMDTFLMFDGKFGYVFFWVDLAKEEGLTSLAHFREWVENSVRQTIIKLATITEKEYNRI